MTVIIGVTRGITINPKFISRIRTSKLSHLYGITDLWTSITVNCHTTCITLGSYQLSSYQTKVQTVNQISGFFRTQVRGRVVIPPVLATDCLTLRA